MFAWLLNPSKSLAQHMEIGFSIGLFLTTLMVVIGLAGEYRKGEWWKRHLHIFEIIVVLGVAGEMITESGAFWYSLRLQSIEEFAIVDAQQKAIDSARQAGQLGVTVTNLKEFVATQESDISQQFNTLRTFVSIEDARNSIVIADLRKDRAALDKARTDAMGSVADAKEVLADMTKELDEERVLRSQLLSKLAPRNLSAEQLSSMGSSLKVFEGQEWTVTAYWDSKEPLALANKIFSALTIAGWKYDNEGSKGMLLGGIEGVQVIIHPKADQKTKDAAAALINALNGEGIVAALKEENPQNPVTNKLFINVGSKP